VAEESDINELRVWPLKSTESFTAQVPYINSHRVEVIAQVHWHTRVFTKNPEVRQGKPNFEQRGKPNKKPEAKQAQQHSFKIHEQLHTTKTPMTLLFLKMPIVSE
jgi:hypothetical protein